MTFQSDPMATKQSGMAEWPISTAVGKDMQSMQPWFIRRSPVLSRLMDTYGDELDVYLGLTHEVIAQLFVRTSTWGLDYWELELGLEYTGNLTDTERADRIIAKMRSYRQGTPFVIRLVANSYNLGTVEPIEDFRGRRLIVRFNDIRGVPTNIADLQATLEHLVRASAILEYEYSYLLWQEMHDSGTLWQQLKDNNLTWGQLRSMAATALPAPPLVTIIWFGPDTDDVANHNVDLWWQTSRPTPATGWVDYGPTVSYGTRAEESPDPDQDDWHVCALRGVASGTYHWRATATAVGVANAVMPDQTFTIP